MPLNLSVSDGDFVPYLKYNAKAGRFYAKPENGDSEVEILNPVIAIDMANIKTGWLFYAEGSGPEKVWDSSPDIAAPKPPGPRKFKRGFEVMVIGNAEIPGTGQRLGLREFSSTAANVITAILRMHAEYEAGMAANVGKVPVYACKGVKPINGAYGTNYEPMFQLAQWVERARVPEFDAHTPAPPPPAQPRRAVGGVSDNLDQLRGVQGREDPISSGPPPGHPAGGSLNDDIPFAPEFR